MDDRRCALWFGGGFQTRIARLRLLESRRLSATYSTSCSISPTPVVLGFEIPFVPLYLLASLRLFHVDLSLLDSQLSRLYVI